MRTHRGKHIIELSHSPTPRHAHQRAIFTKKINFLTAPRQNVSLFTVCRSLERLRIENSHNLGEEEEASPMSVMGIQGQFVDSKVCFRFKCFIFFFSSQSLTNTAEGRRANDIIGTEHRIEYEVAASVKSSARAKFPFLFRDFFCALFSNIIFCCFFLLLARLEWWRINGDVVTSVEMVVGMFRRGIRGDFRLNLTFL